MKKLLLLGILLPSISFSQEVISSQGDSYSNAIGSVVFTIGEVVIDTGSDGNNDLTQGFHQTNWNFVGLDDHNPSIEVSVFPNPLEKYLNIQTGAFKGMNYIMYDAAGRIVMQGNLLEETTQIETTELLPASYSLVVRNENNTSIKTFKLVKTQ